MGRTNQIKSSVSQDKNTVEVNSYKENCCTDPPTTSGDTQFP